MFKVCLFGGTGEGRILAQYLNSFSEIEITYCVATEYGQELLKDFSGEIIADRLNEKEMEKLFSEKLFDLIIDATHPYATCVTENILFAKKDFKSHYIRVCRDISSGMIGKYFIDIESAVSYINTQNGNIMLTTGSKELDKFTAISDYSNRVFPRILPLEDSITACKNNGYSSSNIIAMQGPFTYELNKALIKAYDINLIVTKECGIQGGYIEKLKAAEDTGIQSIIIGAPPQMQGLSLNDTILNINKKFGLNTKANITLIGTGVGHINQMTQEAISAIKKADVVIGAKRLIEEYSPLNCNTFCGYLPNDILKFIESNPKYRNIAILMSGDIGFFSGAKALREVLSEYDVYNICGISSPVYLCARLGMSWQEMNLVSVHGRSCNIIHHVRKNHFTFCLTGGEITMKELIKRLCEYNLGDTKIYVGERLSYDNECITVSTAQELLGRDFHSLSCCIIENLAYNNSTELCIPEEDFIRHDGIPMTKSEVRAISIAKLNLTPNSIIYDIGAGTGSFSIESGRISYNGKVFAIEKKYEACVLIRENMLKLFTDNIEIIEGMAPDAMNNLPIPTHAFIGGSSGNLKEIITLLLEKNPKIRVVINAVTLETIGEVVSVVKEMSLSNSEFICMNIAKGKKIGSYNLMYGQNPVYVVSFGG